MAVIEQQASELLLPAPAPAEPLSDRRPTHWRCEDCFQPCNCDPAIRDLVPHVRCGLKED